MGEDSPFPGGSSGPKHGRKGRSNGRERQKDQERVLPVKKLRDIELRRDKEAMLKPYLPATENSTVLRDWAQASSSNPHMRAPEFVYGGSWASTREQSELLEEDTPTPTCHAGTVVHLGGGGVLAAWVGGTDEGQEDTAIYSASRDPTQETWQSPRKVVKVHRDVPYTGSKKNAVSQGGEPHWNPVLFCGSPLGVCGSKILLFFKIGWQVSTWQTFVTESEDGGQTWGVARELISGGAGGRGPDTNKPIILTDGTWLAGASVEGSRWNAFVDRSTDQGSTWIRSENIAFRDSTVGVSQPTMWESAPGVVHMLMRSSHASQMNIMQAKSRDGGRSWTPARRTSLPSNNAGIDVARMPYSGGLVLAYNPVTSGKTPLRLTISQDEGRTWPLAWDVESQHPRSSDKRTVLEFAYPSIIPWPDYVQETSLGGQIAFEEGFTLIYSWNRQRMAFLSMSLEDLRSKCKANPVWIDKNIDKLSYNSPHRGDSKREVQ
eukprot:CAMPEP_0196585416 /NCGR_PEP_ID=MMETSP1081-20130531/50550_1 /TAXON_ID=36882 /ORGANISM="Pyramimonas amylifera, Strain CCMP720" /LENGTH=489 /DNA_ID=CAMNT_0041906947 /DNA_START=297 /DNA_END=1766 /DNA_ORIENTATION=+